MTNASGESVDLAGLGKKFEKFTQKVGLAGKSLKVVKESALPQWARYEGLGAAQVAGICAATACEGGLNPVVTVCIPTARTIALQSLGRLGTASQLGTISGLLATFSSLKSKRTPAARLAIMMLPSVSVMMTPSAMLEMMVASLLLSSEIAATILFKLRVISLKA